MEVFTSNLNKKLDNSLQLIELDESDSIRKVQRAISCIKNALNQLKAFIINYSFRNEQEEILFFKQIKPDIFSKLIYHVKVFNIESRHPLGSYNIQKKFLCQELGKLTFFFNSHLEFYQYYRMNSTYLDDKYFIRAKEDLHLYHDSLMFYIDPDFSTSHDYMVATILAHDRLEVYLNKELESLSTKASNPHWGQLGFCDTTSLQWTDSKTSLVELIYALNAAGVINNGNSEIRELSALFEQIFNVRFTDIYHTYIEIKMRTTPTKFIDNLKAALLRKMEEDL